MDEYPVSVEGELQSDLNRWLPLVKWLLIIPHVIVLAFLWVAVVILVVVAFFAILLTGHYPRGIFDFNLGVLRWSWRVGYYSYSLLGTDKYPPFSLSDVDYPARIGVEYPERLSRGLVLVKWILAIPHFVVVGFFQGGVGPRSGSGLNGIIVFFAAAALLFTGRYPESLYNLNMGMNRWTVRVAVYALLMRDEYPPFRLDP